MTKLQIHLSARTAVDITSAMAFVHLSRDLFRRAQQFICFDSCVCARFTHPQKQQPWHIHTTREGFQHSTCLTEFKVEM